MRKNLLVFLVLLLTSITSLYSQTCNAGKYVVGYMPSWAGTASSIQYDKLSHVIYAFIRPTTTGGLTPLENPAKLQEIVTLARARGVKVLMAVGGWSDLNNADFQSMASNASYRATFINNMVNFINQYQLDGVDMDWEYPREGNDPANFATLMTELGNAMHSRGKLLTAAVSASGYYADGVQPSVFAAVDFLNLMVYDGGDGAAHSPYSYAVASLDYWLGRGLPASKAVLGVPFYARPGFASYASLLSQGADPNADVFNGAYYNGIPTIKQKAELAKSRAAGIMIWELSQDAVGANSLLSAINTVIKPCLGGTTNTPPTVSISSPTSGTTFNAPATITINANASDANGSVTQVAFYNGGTLLGTDASNPYSFAWSNVAAGSYTITAVATDNQGATTTSSAVNVTVNGTSSRFAIPGTIQAESYSAMFGIQTEATTDAGAGTNVGWIEAGDWMDYNVTVNTAGSYTVEYRVASQSGGGSLQLRSAATTLATTAIPSTGAWQTWTSVSATVNLSAGNQTLRLHAAAGGFNINWVKFTSTTNGNTPPTVNLTSPASGASFTSPASVVINANASDANGSVTQVAFYNGSTLLGTDTSNPYSFTWSNVAAGTYSITARATDNQGATTTSAAVSITVTNGTGGGSCAGKPQYVENGGYVAGSQVQNGGRLYQCKPYPFTGWCNGGAWAYAPGTGLYWQDAWTLVASCTTAKRSQIDAITSTEPVVYPNPNVSGSTVNVALDKAYSNVKVTIKSVSGGKEYSYSFNNSKDLQINLPTLPKGVFILKVETGDQVWKKKLLNN